MGFVTDTLRRNWRTYWTTIAQLADVVVIGLCLVLTAIAYDGPSPLSDVLLSNLRFAIFALLLVVGINVARGLYRKISYISFGRQLYHASRSYFYSAAVVFSGYYLAHNSYYTHGFLVIFFLLLPPVYLAVWAGLRALGRKLGAQGYGRLNTLLVGSRHDLVALESRISNHPELGYDVRSVITIAHPVSAAGLVHVDAKKVEKVCTQLDIELIVFSSGHLNGSFDALEEFCARRGTVMRMVSVESEFLFSRARLQDFAGIPLFWPRHKKMEQVSDAVKRAFDIVGSLLGLLILSPLFTLVAILTKMESPGPVFFRQKRSLSDHDRSFEFIKFRSMQHLADQQKVDLEHRNEATGALFKIKDDPRLTRVGRYLRRYSIDELPQLINVLKGEMSLVGPRPLPVSDFKRITSHDHMGGYFRQRARAKPGITGLWQISGRSDLGFREMVLLDLYYIENQTILFDIEILLQTIPVVLFGKGAY